MEEKNYEKIWIDWFVLFYDREPNHLEKASFWSGFSAGKRMKR